MITFFKKTFILYGINTLFFLLTVSCLAVEYNVKTGISVLTHTFKSSGDIHIQDSIFDVAALIQSDITFSESFVISVKGRLPLESTRSPIHTHSPRNTGDIDIQHYKGSITLYYLNETQFTPYTGIAYDHWKFSQDPDTAFDNSPLLQDQTHTSEQWVFGLLMQYPLDDYFELNFNLAGYMPLFSDSDFKYSDKEGLLNHSWQSSLGLDYWLPNEYMKFSSELSYQNYTFDALTTVHSVYPEFEIENIEWTCSVSIFFS